MTEAILALFFFLFVGVVAFRPATALAATLSVYAIEQLAQANSTFFASHPTLVNYCFGGLLIFGLVVTSLTKGLPTRHIPVTAWLIYAMVAMSWMSYFWSYEPEATREVTRGYFPYFAANAILMPLLFREPQDLRTGFFATIILGVPLAIFLLISTHFGLSGRGFEFSGAVMDRYGKELAEANPLAIGNFGGYLILVGLFIQSRGITRWVGVARWAVIALGFAVVVRSGSRGQFAAAIGVSASLLALSSIVGGRISRAVMALIGAGALTAIVMWSVQFSEMEGRFDFSNWQPEFTETRVAMCTQLIEHWVNNTSPLHWLIGMGAGASWAVLDNYPHVVPVEILVELGLLGILLYVAIILSVVWSGLRLLRRFRKSPVGLSCVMCLAALWLFEWLLTMKQGTFLADSGWMGVSILVGRMDLISRPLARQATRGVRSAEPRVAPGLPPLVPSPT